MKKKMEYTVEINAKVQQLNQQLEKSKKELKSFLEAGQDTSLQDTFSLLTKSLKSLQERASQPITSQSGFTAIIKDATTLSNRFDTLEKNLKVLQALSNQQKIDFLPPDQKKRLDETTLAIQNLVKEVQEAYSADKELLKAEKDLEAARKKKGSLQIEYDSAETVRKKAKAEFDITKENYEKLEKQKKAHEAALQKFESVSEKYDKHGWDKAQPAKWGRTSYDLQATKKSLDATPSVDEKAYQSALEAYNAQKKASEAAEKSAKRAKNALDRQAEAVGIVAENYKKVSDEVSSKKVLKGKENYSKIVTLFQKWNVAIDDLSFDETTGEIKNLDKAVSRLTDESLKDFNALLNETQKETKESIEVTAKLRKELKDENDDFTKQNEIIGRVDSVVSRAKEFVGLAGAGVIVRKVFQNASKAIKELDAQMTEMAVVTDLDIGDYWSQLPEYTKRANELGVSIKSAYESATLFYQQGLKTNEVMAVSNSTLKMARIAGLSAEDATNKMTAALRGFNMEINQVNADRVADVYSELAAITASDVKEISTAMTKTASLASNAGMEFETTAAFLSQIIETTRESAETAGTAMKTILARFQELKKSPNEIGTIDGEIVDANKIETALRNANVALRDEVGNFRDADDVLLELASKWDTLDKNTQRYIATEAAGSRQQSRFIAMMSNYERTQELVMAANDSMGASTEQFEKTLESLETALTKLHNAWDTFTMGLVHNDLIKGAIDLLTGLITGVNKLADSLGSLGGAIVRIGTLTAALAAGDIALKKFLTTWETSHSIFSSVGAIFKRKKPGKGDKGSTEASDGEDAEVSSLRQKVKKIKALLAEKRKAYRDDAKLQSFENDLNKRVEEKGGRKNHTRRAARRAHKKADKAYQELVGLKVGVGEGRRKNPGYNLKEVVGQKKLMLATMNGLTKATKYQGKALKDLNRQQAKDLVNSYADIAVTQKQNVSGKLRGLILLKEAMVTKLSNKAIIGSTVAKINDAFAAKAASMATHGWSAANVTLMATLGPILAIVLPIVAAVALLAVGIYAIVKAVKKAKENSPEKKLERANQQLNEAQEAAKNASDAYADLTDKLKSLNDESSRLKTLSIGTTEWKNTLEGVNNTVLELIDKYPELIDYTKFENGQLSISREGQDLIAQKSQQNKAETQMAAYVAKVAKSNQETSNKIAASKKGVYLIAENYNEKGEFIGDDEVKSSSRNSALIEPFIRGLMDRNLDLRNDNDYEGVKTLLKELLPEYEHQQEEYYNENYEERLDKLVLALQENSSQFTDLIAEIRKAENANRLPFSLIGEEIADDMVGDSAGAKNSIEHGFAAVLGAQRYEEIYNQRKDTFQSIKLTNEDKEEYAENHGLIYSDGKFYKKDENGLRGDEYKLNKAEEEGMKNEIGAKQTKEQAKREVELMGQAIEKRANDPKSAQLFQKYVATNGQGLTAKEIKQLKDNNEDLFRDISYYIPEISLNKGSLGEAFQLDSSLTIGQQQGAANQFQLIKDKNKNSNISGLNNAFNAVFSEVPEHLRDEFIRAFNGMDLTDSDSVESFVAQMKSAGLYTDKMASLIDDIKETGIVIEGLDFEKITEQVIKQKNIIDSIRDNKEGIFEKEEYENLLVNYADLGLQKDFIQDANGNFVYVGGAMEDLAKKLEENTKAMLDRKIEAAEERGEGTVEQNANLYSQRAMFDSISGIHSSSFGIYYDPTTNQLTDNTKARMQGLSGAFSAKALALGADGGLIEKYKQLTNDLLTNGFSQEVRDEQIAAEKAIMESLSKQLELNDKINDIDAEIYGLKKEKKDAERQHSLLQEIGLLDQKGINKLYGPNGLRDLNKTAKEEVAKKGIIEQEVNDALNRGKEKYTGLYTVENGKIRKNEEAALDLTADEMEELDAWISDTQGKLDKQVQNEEDIYNIAEEVVKLLSTGKKEYYSLLKDLKTAMQEDLQQSITNAEKVNQSISSLNNKLISTMRESISKQRQERDNKKTEESLQDKYTKLAYLRQDTSGNNANAIASLEKEIAEAEQGYQDKLIDQEISEMEKVNRKAEEQRKEQIQIMKDQLDFWKTNEAANEADEMLRDSLLKGDFANSAAGKLILGSKKYDDMTDEEKAEAERALQQNAALAKLYINGNRDNKLQEILNNISTALPNLIKALNNGIPDYKSESTEGGLAPVFNGVRWESKPFASGGLADFTGPAWLDGTKSKPEMVLNPQDTKNFLVLRDILSGFISARNRNEAKNQPNLFDINISVDKIENDYDVDRMAERVKNIIYSQAEFGQTNSL